MTPFWMQNATPEQLAFGSATSESYGLDYNSARDATPRWYGVSSGNGNDGVSHTFPEYYCRCTSQQAFELAAAAMLSTFKPSGYEWAKENMTIDGESDYTITAEILDPPDNDSEGVYWSDMNGAWFLIEVFPVDDTDGTTPSYDPRYSSGNRCPVYHSLADCFTPDLLKLAAE